MRANSQRAVDAVTERNWDMVILGIAGVAEEFRGVMELCGTLPGPERGEYIQRCGLEHHAAKARIAAAMKTAFEERK